MHHLEQIKGFDITAAASDSNYLAYRLACKNGYLEVVQHLEKIAGFKIKTAASAEELVYVKTITTSRGLSLRDPHEIIR